MWVPQKRMSYVNRTIAASILRTGQQHHIRHPEPDAPVAACLWAGKVDPLFRKEADKQCDDHHTNSKIDSPRQGNRHIPGQTGFLDTASCRFPLVGNGTDTPHFLQALGVQDCAMPLC